MKIVLFVLGIIVVALLGFLSYWGAFKKVQVSKAVVGGETLVYKEITGDYRQTGLVMDEVYYRLLNDYNIETYKGFGIYYDNPQKVEKDKLRSEAGCIVEEKDVDKLADINTGFATKVFPNKEYITTEFPYKGKLSVMFSLFKVYPALMKYASENGYSQDTPVMEIYDIPNKRIMYRKEIK